MLTACVFVTRDTVVIRDALCSENLFVNRIVHEPRFDCIFFGQNVKAAGTYRNDWTLKG
jgi:hypothetical protein